MPVPDAHTRSKISLNPSNVVSPTSISSKTLPRIVLANLGFVLAIQATKKWLLDYEVGAFWVLMRVLACGGVGVLVWEALTGQVRKRKSIEWSALALASLLVFVQFGSLFTALYRLSSIRVILFSYFSAYLVNLSSARKTLMILAAFALGILSDASFSRVNMGRYLPGYGALLLHGLTTMALEHTVGFISPSLGPSFTMATATLGASIFCVPFYLFRNAVLHFPPTPHVPFLSVVSIPLIAYALLFLTPLTKLSFNNLSLAPQFFQTSFPILGGSSVILGPLIFSHYPSLSDLPLSLLLFTGMYPESVSALPLAPRTPASRLIKSYLKAILSNPESRKIFYFLMLNLCYMAVQMLYGVWTNSLGLISDAIHMAFDCMAIGVGLLASVMATWEPNERFTYGYGRIETLSGFANGIFLILISIFIVFEAIQRILDPPEMSTNQLLLVSSVGLAVNLFGMFAMGGHHHGGGGHSHSHSHALPFSFFGSSHGEDDHDGHSHDHGHSHSDHGHSHSEKSHHDHSHSEKSHDGHSHAPHSEQNGHSHSGHGEPNGHSHSHSHSPPAIQVSHSHEADHHGHSHSPHREEAHSHGHSHAPSPSLSHSSHSHSDDHHDAHCESPGHEHHDHGHEHDDHGHSHDSHSHSHSHSHSPPPAPVAPEPIGHSRSLSKDKPTLASRRHSRGGSLSIQADAHLDSKRAPVAKALPSAMLHTPITPAYTFGHDDHIEHHHHNVRTPNVPQPSKEHAHAGHSHNMRGVFLHVMADTLGSVGVIISTLLIQFYGWTGFDPIASLFIAVLIAASVIPLVIDTGKILALDVGDKDAAIQEALHELSSIEGVASYSCPRFWPKDAESVVGSIHIQLAPSASSYDPSGPHSSMRTTYTSVDRVVDRVDSFLRRKIPGLENLTIQVEGRPIGGHL